MTFDEAEFLSKLNNPPAMLTSDGKCDYLKSRLGYNLLRLRLNQPAPQPAPVVDPFEEAMKIVAAERRTGGTRE